MPGESTSVVLALRVCFLHTLLGANQIYGKIEEASPDGSIRRCDRWLDSVVCTEWQDI